MMIDTLLEKVPQWTGDQTPENGRVVMSQCSLVRNLADFPFPARCNEEEKAAVVERVLTVLDNLNLLAEGRFYNLQDLDAAETRLLAERQLITFDLMRGHGARGVFVSDDQRFSIMVNGANHLCLRSMMPGLQVQQAWSQATMKDDTLAGVLDFAFDERLGYLSGALDLVGTGLKCGVLLHLPGLRLANRLQEQVERAESQRLLLHGVGAGPAQDAKAMKRPKRRMVLEGPAGTLSSAAWSYLDQSMFSDVNGPIGCPVDKTVGDLFMLVNRSTLGRSEEEIAFHVRNTATEILADESAARETLLGENRPYLEDRVGRAQGAARGARLLSYSEGLELLSSLRFGASAGVIADTNVRTINEVMLGAQCAHLSMTHGMPNDNMALSMRRADLFRSRFA